MANKRIPVELNDTNNTTRRAVAKFSTADLQTEAIGAELSARNSPLAGPAWVEVDREDGFRLSFSVRVF